MTSKRQVEFIADWSLVTKAEGFMLQVQRNAQVTFLRAPQLAGIPGIVHAFSTRRGENDDFAIGPDRPETEENRERFMAAIGVSGWPSFRPKQIHSNIVHEVDDNASVNERPEGDAAFTSLAGIALGVATADCVPILIADSRSRSVAAVHAGWRGTSEGVARRTADRMVEEARIDAGDLWIVIGPHIGVCCMEVGEEVYDWFAQPEIFERREEWTKPHLNLAEANRHQLVEAGVDDGHVIVSSLCTKCRPDLFYSYRRDGDQAGRMFSLIGIEP